MVNYVCEKTVADFTKLRLIKGPKSKFPRGACPQTPLLFARCFAHGYILSPSPHNDPCNLNGKLDWSHYMLDSIWHVIPSELHVQPNTQVTACTRWFV